MRLVLLLCLVTAGWSYDLTELDEYVWRPDDSYMWELLDVQSWRNCTIYTLYLVSQTWYSEEWVDYPVWWHHYQVVVPDNLNDIKHWNHGLLLIEGGSRTSGIPDQGNDFLQMCCQMTKDVGAVSSQLRQVPNQPIKFWDDPSGRGRSEDAMIAWTWEEFRINKTGGDFLAQCPMTKAAIKAMDAMIEFTSTLDPRFNISKFLVTGGSKRGWATWTAAAVDPERVVAQAPLVLPSLNFVDVVNHYYQALGAWSWTLKDYWELNLTLYLDEPNTQRIFDIVDPYIYRERYKGMPTYVLMSCGDEFFMPDDTYYWWDDMEQPIYLNVVPNAEHSLITRLPYVYRSLRSFVHSVLEKFKLPVMTWTKEYSDTGGRLSITMDTVPVEVVGYHSPTLSHVRRDYRLVKPYKNNTDVIIPYPVLWYKTNVTTVDEYNYYVEYLTPAEGWEMLQLTAYFENPLKPNDRNWDIVLTSEVLFLPNVLPYPKCQGDQCYSYLM